MFSGLSTMKVALIILAIVILFVAVLVKVSVKLADAEKLKVFESQVDLSTGALRNQELLRLYGETERLKKRVNLFENQIKAVRVQVEIIRVLEIREHYNELNGD